jgi:hypothetical protein
VEKAKPTTHPCWQNQLDVPLRQGQVDDGEH